MFRKVYSRIKEIFYQFLVAIGRRPHLVVFGNDWETPDGTGVRDWIHVVDLAVGHIAALNKLPSNAGIKVYNLGTGRGYSVLEAVKEFEKASGKEVKYVIGPRRPGDLANVVADAQLSEKVKFNDFIRKLTKISYSFLILSI